MEIYTTDRFSRKAVIRPAVRPALGVRPSGSVLELELTADGYTPEELRELLAAYRLGKKYHKLKDGSFSILDDGLSELFEITESLDISDKSLMKEKSGFRRSECCISTVLGVPLRMSELNEALSSADR